MAINNFTGKTFVAFLDISGFKQLMNIDDEAVKALDKLYSIGYQTLLLKNGVEGLFVSDSGILFSSNNADSNTLKLSKLLRCIKTINQEMLQHGYMLTTGIAYGNFSYQERIEFPGIEKNAISGFAYVNAYLDNEVTSPKLQPGQCRLVIENLPPDIDFNDEQLEMLIRKNQRDKHYYFYWNLQNKQQIFKFEKEYKNSYNLKYKGMLEALKKNYNI